MKFIATATRKNIDGKPDYRWVFSYANGNPVTFDSAKNAFDCAKSKCSNSAYGLYNPKAEKLTRNK